MPQSVVRRPRWGLLIWPLALVLALATAAIAFVYVSNTQERQQVVVGSLMVLVAASALVLLWSVVWLLGPSGLPWRFRLGGLAGLAAIVIALVASVTVRDFSGDMQPILGWRWSETPAPVVSHAGIVQGGLIVSASDWTGFLGPRRDARLPGVRIAPWSEPPRELWRRPVGEAWSGFAVAGDFAVTQEQRGEQELVTCYDVRSGAPRWTHADRARWEDSLGGVGPRATPTIQGSQVITLGGTGILNVLDLVNGEVQWTVDTVEDNAGRIPEYGVSASPLVVDGRVVVPAGGSAGASLVAYDLQTGDRVWSAGDDPAAYSSPLAATLGGVRQVLILNDAAVVGHDAADGTPLWRFPWPDETQNASQPIPMPDGRVFLSTGYGVGAKMFRPSLVSGGGWAVEQLWESRGLKAKFTNVVLHDGYLYGLDDGILACLDPVTGKRCWKRGRYGHGQVLLVGQDLLVLAEDGEVALVQIGPDASRELASFAAISGKTWNHPALAGSVLIVRNDHEAAAFELSIEFAKKGEDA